MKTGQILRWYPDTSWARYQHRGWGSVGLLGSSLIIEATYGVLKRCNGKVCTKHLAFRGSCPLQPGMPTFPKPTAQSWRQPSGTVPCRDAPAAVLGAALGGLWGQAVADHGELTHSSA